MKREMWQSDFLSEGKERMAERNIRFEELGKERTFALHELQVRADTNPLAEECRQYRVLLDENEAAYLSFDVWLDELNLYEVFVAEVLRNQGIGTRIISFAIDLGKQMGKTRLTVRPRPLSDQPEADLVAWYLRRGFTPTASPELLEIILA